MANLPVTVQLRTPLPVALADTIDPTVRGLFVPARVRDAAADLLLAARTTTAQES